MKLYAGNSLEGKGFLLQMARCWSPVLTEWAGWSHGQLTSNVGEIHLSRNVRDSSKLKFRRTEKSSTEATTSAATLVLLRNQWSGSYYSHTGSAH